MCVCKLLYMLHTNLSHCHQAIHTHTQTSDALSGSLHFTSLHPLGHCRRTATLLFMWNIHQINPNQAYNLLVFDICTVIHLSNVFATHIGYVNVTLVLHSIVAIHRPSHLHHCRKDDTTWCSVRNHKPSKTVDVPEKFEGAYGTTDCGPTLHAYLTALWCYHFTACVNSFNYLLS